MNCTQANEIQIVDFLSKSGFKPAAIKGRDYWYCSPIRNDKNPSFKVDSNKNVWYDFGAGYGGRLVDLVCRINHVDIAGALVILSGSSINYRSFSFSQQKKETLQAPKIEIKHVQSLKNKALIQYLEERGISKEIASRHLEEAYYAITECDSGEIKKYFALAFENDHGGYELRNKYFKGSCSPKAITTIQGQNKGVNVFEGFMDFLSLLEFYKIDHTKNTNIVLNSLSHLSQLFDLLSKYEHINLFLDHDEAGLNAVKEIKDRYPKAVNQAAIVYPDKKDFNEFILSNKR